MDVDGESCDYASPAGHTTSWQHAPDNVLLKIFSFLHCQELLRASCVCKMWHRIAHDDFLWKDLTLQKWTFPESLPRLPHIESTWLEEYKRLYYETPIIRSETHAGIHTDEVWHVRFSHGGHLFATCSKDATVKVRYVDLSAFV